MAFGRSGQRGLERPEHAFQGAAHLDGHRGDVAEFAGDAVKSALPDAPRRLRQTARRVAENAVQAVHQREGIVGELLFLLTGQAAVEGGCRPLADAHPVAGFDGAPQGIDGAQHALAGPVFYLAPQAVQGVGGAVLDGLGHLFGAVGGDSLDGLHRAERPSMTLSCVWVMTCCCSVVPSARVLVTVWVVVLTPSTMAVEVS